MSSNEEKTPHRVVKWSPPYRRENVEQPVFDLIEIEIDGPIGRIILNTPEKRNPLGYERYGLLGTGGWNSVRASGAEHRTLESQSMAATLGVGSRFSR